MSEKNSEKNNLISKQIPCDCSLDLNHYSMFYLLKLNLITKSLPQSFTISIARACAIFLQIYKSLSTFLIEFLSKCQMVFVNFYSKGINNNNPCCCKRIFTYEHFLAILNIYTKSSSLILSSLCFCCCYVADKLPHA